MINQNNIEKTIKSKEESLKNLESQFKIDSEKYLTIVNYRKRLQEDIDMVNQGIYTLAHKIKTTKHSIQSTQLKLTDLRNTLNIILASEKENHPTNPTPVTNNLEMDDVHICIYTHGSTDGRVVVLVIDKLMEFSTTFYTPGEDANPSMVEKLSSYYSSIIIKQRAFYFNGRLIRVKPTTNFMQTVKIGDEYFELVNMD